MNVDDLVTRPASSARVDGAPRRDALAIGGRVALAIVLLGWATILTIILAHPVFVTHDSLISYAHAWWIENRLWHGTGIPWRMPVLGHGKALTFPYGALPWTVAAVLWPMFGQWSVTLVLVLGVVGVIAATFWAFPETRRPWWAVAVLLNPVLLLAPLSGQLPFLWATALLLAGVGCWRRSRPGWAVVLVALAQLTHIAVVGPIALVLVLVRLRTEPRRRLLLGCYALSVCLAAPAIWPVVSSPVFTDSSLLTKAGQFVGTVSIRIFILAGPIVALLLVRHRQRWIAPALAALGLTLNVALLAPLDAGYAWGALARPQDKAMARYVSTPEFAPGATYRVLRSGDGKISLYQLIRGGARLDSEFFPESIWYGDFAGERAYSAFLAGRNVDRVLVFHPLARTNITNEGDLLTAMAGRPCADGVAGVRLVGTHPDWADYAIDRSCLTGRGR
ncbi:MAG: hypothetical protein ABJB98_03360 [Actinomycetota bacterium]